MNSSEGTSLPEENLGSSTSSKPNSTKFHTLRPKRGYRGRTVAIEDYVHDEAHSDVIRESPQIPLVIHRRNEGDYSEVRLDWHLQPNQNIDSVKAPSSRFKRLSMAIPSKKKRNIVDEGPVSLLAMIKERSSPPEKKSHSLASSEATLHFLASHSHPPFLRTPSKIETDKELKTLKEQYQKFISKQNLDSPLKETEETEEKEENEEISLLDETFLLKVYLASPRKNREKIKYYITTLKDQFAKTEHIRSFFQAILIEFQEGEQEALNKEKLEALVQIVKDSLQLFDNHQLFACRDLLYEIAQYSFDLYAPISYQIEHHYALELHSICTPKS